MSAARLNGYRHSLVVAALVLWPDVGRAGGFETEYPDNGARALGRAGAFVAKSDDGSAIYYNPAGLTRGTGGALYVSANLMSYQASFQPDDRKVSLGNRLVSVHFEEAEQDVPIFVAPFLSYRFDFEGLPDFDFAAGIYGPAANGDREWPDQWRPNGATDDLGADAVARVEGNRQRTLVPNGLIVVAKPAQIFPTASVAYRVSPTLSIGLSLQNSIVIAKISQGSGGAYPGQAILEVVDLFAPTGVFGLQWAPLPFLELGLSARPPIYVEAKGKATLRKYAECGAPGVDGSCANGAPGPAFGDPWPLSGELNLRNADGSANDGVTMSFVNPTWVRLGARFVDRDGQGQERFDVELDYIFEQSSLHRHYALDFDASHVNLPASEGVGTTLPMPDLKDLRRYQDTHAVRLGGDLAVIPGRAFVRAGLGYETGVSPPAYTHLDFPGTDRLTAAMGLGYRFDLVELDLGFSFSRFAPRQVSNSDVRLVDVQTLDREKWEVVGNGGFEANYYVTGLSSHWSF